MLKSSLGKKINTIIGMFSIHNSERSEKIYKSYSGFFGFLFLFLILFFCSRVFYLRTNNHFFESLDYPVFYLAGLLGSVVFSMSIYLIYGLVINLYLWNVDRKHEGKMTGELKAQREKEKKSKRFKNKKIYDEKIFWILFGTLLTIIIGLLVKH